MNLSIRVLCFALGLIAAFGAGVWFGGRTPHNETPRAASAAPPGAVVRGNSSPGRETSGAFDPGAVLAEASHAERNFRAADLLRKLTAQNWRSVADAFDRERRSSGKTFPAELALFAYRLGEVAGKEGAEFFAAAKDYDSLRKTLTGWSGTDPQAALNWIARDADDETRRLVKGAVIRGLAATEPDLAIAALEDIPLGARENYVFNFASALVQSVGLGQSEALIDGMARRAIANGTGDDNYIRRVFAEFAALKLEHAFRNGDPRPALDWLRQQAQQPYVDRGVIAETAGYYGRTDPLAALAWLQDVNQPFTARDPNNSVGFRELLSGWAQKDGLNTVGQWLHANPDQRNYDRLALNYASMVASKDPAAAATWVNGIKNPALRKQTSDALQRALAPKK
ncbi:MAG TPA: hypothetical protein VM029_15555 [Opitutaceae bacterium]|nr:hypothetical protein [Opitutaceae bacterium]